MKRGFTLVEILIVMTLIGILVAIAIPNFSKSTIRAREAVLKENLHQIRMAINNFYMDKKKYPTALEDLVVNKYLRTVPQDPILRKAEWELIHFETDDMEELDPEALEGIIDVKSKATGTALDGSKYSEW